MRALSPSTKFASVFELNIKANNYRTITNKLVTLLVEVNLYQFKIYSTRILDKTKNKEY